MYISEQHVAEIAKQMSESKSNIEPLQRTPKHQITTDKLRKLGMTFGGEKILEQTVAEMLKHSSQRQ